jgi:hypothetical protein
MGLFLKQKHDISYLLLVLHPKCRTFLRNRLLQ